ncbi:MAG: hypothetical protein QOE54_3312 [Streptosporangiaceae bacterium]|nr:hypothetical protein [Streptosporangiaceae bacterium]
MRGRRGLRWNVRRRADHRRIGGRDGRWRNDHPERVGGRGCASVPVRGRRRRRCVRCVRRFGRGREVHPVRRTVFGHTRPFPRARSSTMYAHPGGRWSAVKGRKWDLIDAEQDGRCVDFPSRSLPGGGWAVGHMGVFGPEPTGAAACASFSKASACVSWSSRGSKEAGLQGLGGGGRRRPSALGWESVAGSGQSVGRYRPILAAGDGDDRIVVLGGLAPGVFHRTWSECPGTSLFWRKSLRVPRGLQRDRRDDRVRLSE